MRTRTSFALLLGLGLACPALADPQVLTIGDGMLMEGNGTIVKLGVPVTRSGDTAGGIDLGFETLDGATNPATAGDDYIAVPEGAAILRAGATSVKLPIRIKPDRLVEADEQFLVQLTRANNVGPPPVFAAAANITVAASGLSLAIGDVNGDGRPDLASASASTNDVAVALNTTTPGASTPTYSAPVSFTVGSLPWYVAMGDVNGDGRPDLAVANYSSADVSVLLNTTAAGASTPSFSSATNFVLSGQPFSVAMGEVNGDGRPDLVVGNYGGLKALVLLNTTAAGASTPSFAAPVAFGTGDAMDSVRHAALADVDGDGRQDLLATGYHSSSVAVLLNTTAAGASTPSFGTPTRFGAGDDPYAIATGDVNGDGRPDLAVPNYEGDAVSVLLNTTEPGGTPAFADAELLAAGVRPVSVFLGDVNNDGRPDLAVSNSDDDNISIRLNRTPPGATRARFGTGLTAAAVAAPRTILMADLNGDGRMEVAAVNSTASTVSVYVNDTDAGVAGVNFDDAQGASTNGNPTAASVADVNGDGRPDLVAADAAISVLLNNTEPGASEISYAAPAILAASAWVVAQADVNGDGRPDLASVNKGTTVDVMLNTTAAGATTPSYGTAEDFAVGTLARSVAFGDFNGDGRPDLAVANEGGKVSVLLNTTAAGATTPSFAAKLDLAAGSSPGWVAVGDLNGDGKPDLASANSNNIAVLLNTTATGATTASFAAETNFDTGVSESSIAIGDFNGDGRPDLAVANLGSNTVSVLLNTTATGATTASFAADVDFTAGTKPYSVAVGDLNGDGRPDIAAANYESDSASVFLNTMAVNASTPAFAAAVNLPVGQFPYAVTLGDVNADGRPDLAVSNGADPDVSILLNELYATRIGPDPATATIRDRPVISIADRSRAEGNDGSTTFRFTVTLSHARMKSTTVDYTTVDGTALASDGDYVEKSGTLTFGPGDTSKAINVQVTGDGRHEHGEKFKIVLSNASDVPIVDDQALGTILNDDNPPAVSFAGAEASMREGGTVEITVKLSSISNLPVKVDFAMDGTVLESELGDLDTPWTIPAGRTQKSFTFAILDDDVGEAEERVVFTLSGAVNATLGALTKLTVRVLDNDGCQNSAPTHGCTVNGASNVECAGTDGNDVIVAGDAGAVILGNGGDDDITGGQGNDLVCGGQGADRLRGGEGHDTLLGGVGGDTLLGQQGNDRLFGEDGNDALAGGVGDDTAHGGSGTDTCEAEGIAACEP